MTIEITGPNTVDNRDQVLVTMTLTNVGDSSIVLYSFSDRIQPAMGGILHFDIVRDDTDTLVCRPTGVVPKYPHERDTSTLSPNQQYVETINLTSFYVSELQEDRPLWDSTYSVGTRVWQSGTYRISCRYQYEHKPSYKGGQLLWRGAAVSNEVTLIIPD
jgi:hypothetical protein